MRKKKVLISSQTKGRPKSMVKKTKNEGFDTDTDSSDVERSPDDFTPYEINPGLTRRRAKELYILYYWTSKQLSEHLGIPESTVKSWIDTPTEGQLSWSQERSVFEQTTFRAMKERCSDEMGKSLSRAMSILNRSLTEADMEGMRLKSPREYKDMVGVLQSLKNMVNLEEGKPSSIVRREQLTQEEVRQVLKELQELDPLMDYDPKGAIN